MRELPALIETAGADKIKLSPVAIYVPVVSGIAAGPRFLEIENPLKLAPPSTEYPAAKTIFAEVIESPLIENEKALTDAENPWAGTNAISM